ncbi:MAG: mevalonate kinase [Patescibacteria group bacterium]|nr:mevalonate kinase [Patescibacteria group bacterium]
MTEVTYAAPGKVILAGEHAVVYGKPALLSAIGSYCYVTVASGSPDKPVPDYIETVAGIVESYLNAQESGFRAKPFRISVTLDFPMGRGLGSSAAFAVAAVAALLHFHTGTEPAKETINTLAYQAEKKFHGKPSGADNTACCYGGLIYYRKEFEFLKTISALNAKLPRVFEEKLLLIDTGKPVETTAEMVQNVAEAYNRNSATTETIMSAIEKLTKRTVVSVVTENLNLFTRCLHDTQEELQRLGIVSEKTANLISEFAEFGTGKVTGAGGLREGSGYILFLAKDRSALEKELTRRGIPFIPFTQDFHGVHCIKPV